MGEAKRRKQMREESLKVCKQLSPARFNHYAIGMRLSFARYTCEELSYWASHDERLLGMVGRDRYDNDYLCMVFARDQKGCFRCTEPKVNFLSARRAEDALLEEIKRIINSKEIDTYGQQGDESDVPVNLLKLPTDFDPKDLHPYFRVVLEKPNFEPARAVLREIGPWLSPEDPHLVEQFQNKGFDQRLWEIYLWAALREFNLDLELLEAPDFLCTDLGIDFCIEATTVGPSEKGVMTDYPKTSNYEEEMNFINEYMPIKFASALTSKLNKTYGKGRHYWDLEKSKDKPFVLAIADFHKSNEKHGTMNYTQGALPQYLYADRTYLDMKGSKPIIKRKPIETHQYKSKKIPSGFFNLPNAENVSAVLFSNAGTVAKFTRMGVVAGFGADNWRYIRIGFRNNPNSNTLMGQPFKEEVLAEGYKEHWSDEIQVFHNPNAINPLPFDWLLGAMHHFYKDGSPYVYGSEGRILSSHTMMLPIQASKK